MRLIGWEWWAALIGVVIFSCIPLIGQLGYIILAFLGAYFFWQADFNWRRATTPAPGTFSFETLSQEQLSRFKSEVILPSLERSCKEDARRRAGFEGNVPVRLSNFCECFARAMVIALSRNDLIFHEKNGKYPAATEIKIEHQVQSMCSN